MPPHFVCSHRLLTLLRTDVKLCFLKRIKDHTWESVSEMPCRWKAFSVHIWGPGFNSHLIIWWKKRTDPWKLSSNHYTCAVAQVCLHTHTQLQVNNKCFLKNTPPSVLPNHFSARIASYQLNACYAMQTGPSHALMDFLQDRYYDGHFTGKQAELNYIYQAPEPPLETFWLDPGYSWMGCSYHCL